MLDKQDLQVLQDMFTASEERTQAKLDAVRAEITASEERTQAKFDALEDRTLARIDASEKRTRTEIAATENRIMAYIESAVMPNFRLLAEGHQTILETLAPKDRVEALEEDVTFLKSVVKSLVQEVSELKKAQ